MALNRKLKTPNLADLGDASGTTLPLASFREFVRNLRRNEFLKLKQTQAYQDDPIAWDERFSDVNDVAYSGLTEKRGAGDLGYRGRSEPKPFHPACWRAKPAFGRAVGWEQRLEREAVCCDVERSADAREQREKPQLVFAAAQVERGDGYAGGCDPRDVRHVRVGEDLLDQNGNVGELGHGRGGVLPFRSRATPGASFVRSRILIRVREVESEGRLGARRSGPLRRSS